MEVVLMVGATLCAGGGLRHAGVTTRAILGLMGSAEARSSAGSTASWTELPAARAAWWRQRQLELWTIFYIATHRRNVARMFRCCTSMRAGRGSRVWC
jgi:hypothetical protein